MGAMLNFVGRLESAPPINELPDQGPRRNPLKRDARKTLQSERCFHGPKAVRDVTAVFLAQCERAIRRAAHHPDFADFGNIVSVQRFALRSWIGFRCKMAASRRDAP